MSILRTYWSPHYTRFLQRRWRSMLLASLLVLLVGAALLWPQSDYTVEQNFIVGQSPLPTTEAQEQERYYNWVASEYVVYGLTDWASGTSFAAAVGQEMGAQGFAHDLDLEALDEALLARAVRSRLTLVATHPDRATAEALGRAAAAVLLRQRTNDLPQYGGIAPEILPLDTAVAVRDDSASDQIVIPLIIFLALLAGPLVALLVEAIDPTIHTSARVEKLLPILGVIPEN